MLLFQIWITTVCPTHSFKLIQQEHCSTSIKCGLGIPNVQLNRLQRLLHSAARIVTQTPPSVSITPVLKSLHWLPIRLRIEYKIILTTFKTLNGSGPQYLKDLLQPYEPTRTLSSAHQNFLSVPVMRLKTYGNRSFQSVAPTLWNTLPDNLRKLTDNKLFKSLLKTHVLIGIQLKN